MANQVVVIQLESLLLVVQIGSGDKVACLVTARLGIKPIFQAEPSTHIDTIRD